MDMPKYDYTTLVDRTGLSSAKWAEMHELNPAVPPGIPPFSVADLDLDMLTGKLLGLYSRLR